MPRITNTVEALSEKLGDSARVAAPTKKAQSECDVVVSVTEVKPAALKKLLTDPQWTTAALTFDSEAALAWAAGANAAHFEAAWLPWYEFAATPEGSRRPKAWKLSVRETPLLQEENHHAYQHMVDRIFTGKGKGIGRIAALSVGPIVAQKWMQEAGVQPASSAAALTVEQWVQLYRRSHDEAGQPSTGHSVGPGHKVSQASGPKGAQMRKVRW